MKKCILPVIILFIGLLSGCRNSSRNSLGVPIKAYNIDFNWGEGGPNGFARPGLWADADPSAHVDWVLNEAGDTATTESVRSMLGKHTRLVTCLANWNGQDPAVVIPAALKKNVGLYGFTKPVTGSLMPPVNYYLSKNVDSLKGDERNIALLARVYNNLPLDYMKK